MKIMSTENTDINLDFSKEDSKAGEKTAAVLMKELSKLSYKEASKVIENTSEEKLDEMLDTITIRDVIRAVGDLQIQILQNSKNIEAMCTYLERISKNIEILERRLGRVEAETLDTHTRLQ